MDNEMWLYEYACSGNTKSIKKLLQENPNIKINKKMDGKTVLHQACIYGKYEVVKLLLEYPDIDVNAKYYTKTPLMIACENNRIEIAELLLQDKRTDITIISNNQSILYKTVNNNFDEITKLILFYGNENHVLYLFDHECYVFKNLEKVSANQENYEMAYLLSVYQKNPKEVKRLIYKHLCQKNKQLQINETYGLVVLYSDDYYQIKNKIIKFFNITRQLPIELQMKICHMIYGSNKEIVTSRDLEFVIQNLF